MRKFKVVLEVVEQNGYLARSLVEYAIQQTSEPSKFRIVSIQEVVSKAGLYKCNVCGEVFDTHTGEGKMHMAKHGRNLKYAIKARVVEEVTERRGNVMLL